MRKKMTVIGLGLLLAMFFVGCENKTTENDVPENEQDMSIEDGNEIDEDDDAPL